MLNKHEQRAVHFLQQAGWTITHNGWPDFACEKGDKLLLVEVKRSGYIDSTSFLSDDQFVLYKMLERHGIDYLVWRPDGLFRLGNTRTELLEVNANEYGLDEAIFIIGSHMSQIAKNRWQR